MKLTNKTILILILLVAICLRFFNYFEIPFTHDEFSALFRLKFDNFSDLIEVGVKKNDTHPAGVQVFLYYWTKLFGFKEWIFKLPFAIFGVLSVFLIYRIGKMWFNSTVGLLSASYLASIQFAVAYSQIARPYISGMFLALLMVYYWSNIMMQPTKNFNRNTLFFIISASLCTYNHHFSLLFAAIVGISGLFFIQRKFLIKYLFCGITIFILYIPHLQIFFYQLSMGGIEGWLAKPQNDFLLQFIYYIFNYSSIGLILALGIILFGVFFGKKQPVNRKLIFLSFVWFITPFLIGFFYSKYENSVIQYSVLIFSFPFLFFVLFGIVKEQNPKINLLLVVAILTVNTLTLIFNRRHYDLFYKSVFKHVLVDYEHLKTKHQTLCVIDSHKPISDYYVSKLGIHPDYIDYRSTFSDVHEFKIFLENKKDAVDQLFFGCMSSISPNIIPLIQEYFPKIEIQNNYFRGTTYLFSKHPNKSKNSISNLTFDSIDSKHWESVDIKGVISENDTINNAVYLMDNNAEWGPVYTIALDSILKNENNFIDISVKVKTEYDSTDLILIGVLESAGNVIYWGSNNYNEFLVKQQPNWVTIYHSIQLSDIDLKHDTILFKTYIWNKSKKKCMLDDFKVDLRDGNPVVYGFNEKMD